MNRTKELFEYYKININQGERAECNELENNTIKDRVNSNETFKENKHSYDKIVEPFYITFSNQINDVETRIESCNSYKSLLIIENDFYKLQKNMLL